MAKRLVYRRPWGGRSGWDVHTGPDHLFLGRVKRYADGWLARDRDGDEWGRDYPTREAAARALTAQSVR